MLCRTDHSRDAQAGEAHEEYHHGKVGQGETSMPQGEVCVPRRDKSPELCATFLSQHEAKRAER